MRRIAYRKTRHIVDALDQVNAAVALTHRAFDLGMTGVTDHHDLASMLVHLGDLDVNLGDERTSRIEYVEAARGGLITHGFRHAVRREHERAAGRNVVERFNEYGPLGFQIVDDKFVMDDLVPHVNGRSELFKRLLDDRNGAI